MKHLLLPILAVAAFLVAVPSRAHAEPEKIGKVIELLHKAKDSDKPLPFLEKAHAVLKEFNPAPPKIAGAPKKNQANDRGAREHKHEAMEAISKAIETAKEGGDVKPKIEHAVALVHEAGELRR